MSKFQTDPCVMNMLGVLLEHEGLLVAARKALESCIKLLEGKGREEEESAAKRNLSRVCLKLGDYAAAAEHALPHAAKDLDSAAILAAAYHGAGMYKESYGAYQVRIGFFKD